MPALSTDAQLLLVELRSVWLRDIEEALAAQDGAHRAYVWQIGDPGTSPAPPAPAPFLVELACRPIDITAQAHPDHPPAADADYIVKQSIDNGATYRGITYDPATANVSARILATTFFGGTHTFKWEMQDGTRALVTPATTGSAPLTFQAGDRLLLATYDAVAVSVAVQIRVQRLNEYRLKGR